MSSQISMKIIMTVLSLFFVQVHSSFSYIGLNLIKVTVIQGASDMGARLSETELQKSLDFCVNLFNPTSPEAHDRLNRTGEVAKELLDIAAPLVDPIIFENTFQVERKDYDDAESDLEASSDVERASETKMVLNKINARRVVHSEYAINNLESEPLGGYVVRLNKGSLGLTKVSMDN